MMKRMMITAAVALLTVPAALQAQASQVNATATVANYFAVSGTGDLAFGTLSRTVDTTVNPAGGANSAQRTLHYNHNVRVTFSNVPSHLTAAGGALQLPVSLTCAARVGAGAWGSSAACSGAQFNLDVGTSLTAATLGFGGTITAVNAAQAVAGNYSATFDIVVTAR